MSKPTLEQRNEKEIAALHEAIAEAIETCHQGVYIGEVTVLKSVPNLRKRLLGVRKPSYIIAKIEVTKLSSKKRKALHNLGWSHHFPFQDALAVGSLASVIGLFTGGLAWIAGGFAAGITAISAERLPHWLVWESLSESFDYEAIAIQLIEANRILLDDKLHILRIDPITEDELKQKKRQDTTIKEV